MTDIVVVATEDQRFVVVQQANNTITVSSPPITSVELTSPGPQGASGAATIGGYTVTVSSLGNGDVLSFDGVNSYWKNTNPIELTDGGNF